MIQEGDEIDNFRRAADTAAAAASLPLRRAAPEARVNRHIRMPKEMPMRAAVAAHDKTALTEAEASSPQRRAAATAKAVAKAEAPSPQRRAAPAAGAIAENNASRPPDTDDEQKQIDLESLTATPLPHRDAGELARNAKKGQFPEELHDGSPLGAVTVDDGSCLVLRPRSSSGMQNNRAKNLMEHERYMPDTYSIRNLEVIDLRADANLLPEALPPPRLLCLLDLPASMKRGAEAKQEIVDTVKAEEHRVKGYKLFVAKDWAAAKAEYDEGIKKNPKDPMLYFNRSSALIKLKAFPDAARDRDECLRLDPNCLKSKTGELERTKEKTVDTVKAEEHKVKGYKLFVAKEWAAAKAEYDEGIKRNPKDPMLYANRASAFIELKAYSDAARDRHECLRLDPNFLNQYQGCGSPAS